MPDGPTEPYGPKIAVFPGSKVSAEVVLHRTLNKTKRIKSVAVVIQWDDDTMSADWSSMKRSELLMAATVLQHTAEREIFPTSGEPQDYTRPA